ncbi:hypothetical protein EV702DRAFT_1154342 [Suillus placidus]|uniref:Uncharacterized protein n=1 Tax=Suillus placidus TaxID=48579 RepID=A0A9P6ZGU5_9AGAM|nr:hypothetical protein EV702DRAFT_1154342 [Suillus placidus]
MVSRFLDWQVWLVSRSALQSSVFLPVSWLCQCSRALPYSLTGYLGTTAKRFGNIPQCRTTAYLFWSRSKVLLSDTMLCSLCSKC